MSGDGDGTGSEHWKACKAGAGGEFGKVRRTKSFVQNIFRKISY